MKFIEKKVVTCFLKNNEKILLVKRSEKVGTYKGKWSGISGYLEEENIDNQALKEIKEETSLNENDIELIRKGESLEVLDETKGIKWIVYPYLFEVKHPEKIRLDWENIEMKWVSPKEISFYSTVPKLKEALEKVL
ncbi:MAG: NUDIX domain-containing protein [Candidatus Bathyarchaeia archaeon]|nr:NUDIX domain-containing protein [Candidatus Bathyarchaeota archaeon]